MDAELSRLEGSTFLVYTGGLTVLFLRHRRARYLAVCTGARVRRLGALAHRPLRDRVRVQARDGGSRRHLAFASVIAWAFFVGALWVWFGWLSTHDAADAPVQGFSVARLSLLLLVLVRRSSIRRPSARWSRRGMAASLDPRLATYGEAEASRRDQFRRGVMVDQPRTRHG